MSDEVFGLDEINNRKIEIDSNFFSKPRERNESLEKEVEEYLRGQTQLNGGLFHCNIRNFILGFAELKEKQITELEQENAELRKKCQDRCDE